MRADHGPLTDFALRVPLSRRTLSPKTLAPDPRHRHRVADVLLGHSAIAEVTEIPLALPRPRYHRRPQKGAARRARDLLKSRWAPAGER